MRFEEVLPALRDGKTIARKDYYYEPENVEKYRIRFVDTVDKQSFMSSYLSWELLLAEDWEVLE